MSSYLKDGIVGKDHKGTIVTLVERKTNFMLMSKLHDGKNADTLANTVVKMLKPFKNSVLTITTDNGLEFAKHKFIAKKLNCDVFFCHPSSPWEKGRIENINMLVREFILKGSSFDIYSTKQISLTQNLINNRPRKKLNYSTPTDAFKKNICTFVLDT